MHNDFPPTFILHATADKLFSGRSSIAPHQKLLDLEASSELHIYADRDHQFDMAPSMTQATVAVAEL